MFSANTGYRLLKPIFEEQLCKEKDNSGNISGLLFEQMDKWADCFRYEKPLVDVPSKKMRRKFRKKRLMFRLLYRQCHNVMWGMIIGRLFL
ncbi:MAG: hypothetical protein IKY98_03235 [Alphaproteobacteria bacterium]|nr:hypothetical protein [Alphaproteobacteria bacterium]